MIIFSFCTFVYHVLYKIMKKNTLDVKLLWIRTLKEPSKFWNYFRTAFSLFIRTTTTTTGRMQTCSHRLRPFSRDGQKSRERFANRNRRGRRFVVRFTFCLASRPPRKSATARHGAAGRCQEIRPKIETARATWSTCKIDVRRQWRSYHGTKRGSAPGPSGLKGPRGSLDNSLSSKGR